MTSQILSVENDSTTIDVCMLAHDIKSPINQVNGLLQIAKKATSDNKIVAILEKALNANNLLYDVVDTMLTNVDKTSNEKVKVDFQKTITEIKSALSGLEGYNDIKIIENIQSNIYYLGDHIIIRSIIQNLVENAIKYRNSRTDKNMIIISAQQLNDSILIKISDNGIGIDNDSLPLIFNQNYRATEDSNGHGVGLYLVKKSLNSLNASIDVESTIGMGTTFAINLPAPSLKLIR